MALAKDATVQLAARGHVEDITGQGVVRTRLELGDLTFVPLQEGNWTALGTGGTLNSYPPGPGAAAEGNPYGMIGSTAYFNLSTATSAMQRAYRTRVFGGGLAIVFRDRTPTSITQPSIAVIIGGNDYVVPRQAVYFNAEPQPVLTATGGLGIAVIDLDLEVRWHTVDVIVTADVAAGNRFALFGFLADKRFYPDVQRPLTTLVPVSVPVSPSAALAIPLAPASVTTPNSPVGPDRSFRFVDHLLFTETSGVAGDVVVFRDGTQIDRVTVPAKGGVEWPRKRSPLPLAIDSTYTVQSPAGTAANIAMTVFGGK